MRKKILLSLGAVLAVVAGVAAMSAWEAHVVNVTATIENALEVSGEEMGIDFGVVFPQENLYEDFTVSMSDSFSEQDRVDTINYVIKQKPKPRDPEDAEYCYNSWYNAWGAFMGCWDGVGGSFMEAWEACKYVMYPDEPTAYDRENCYPYLCPFLSKIPVEGELDDYGVSAPHFPDGIASGLLAIPEDDLSDTWTIDLVVPCFQGQCAQDYNWWEYGPPLVQELDGNEFGCDLWVEVTGISEMP